MNIKRTNPAIIQDETFNDIISKTTRLHIVDGINNEFAFTPNWELDDSKFIKESVRNNLQTYGVPSFSVTKGGGVTIHGEGDFAYSLIVPSGSIDVLQICDFLRDYLVGFGYATTLVGNDILVDGKKIAGIAKVEHGLFGMTNIMGMVTLTDHSELFRKIFGELYVEEGYKIPSFVPLNKDALTSAFIEFLEGVLNEL